MPNPLAIGVTLGGLLLDLIVPRPKPRVGLAYGSPSLSPGAGSRTPLHMFNEGHERQLVAGG